MMIKCAECGFENDPGHIYCAKCKMKLNLDQISSESIKKSARPDNHRLQILQFIILVVLICLAFALWPVPVETGQMSGPEFAMARNKMNKLQQGVLTEPVDFSEKAVNMLFNHLLQENARRPGYESGLISISAAQVTISRESMTVCLSYQAGPLVFGPVQIGPFWVSYEVTGRPEAGPSGLDFTALNGAAGHLPLPLLGGGIGKARLQNIFIPFKNARVFLSRLEIVEMQHGSIKVKYSK
jgi:hypothetical protein